MGKKLIGDVFYHHQNGIGVLFFQLLGVGIQLKTAGFGGFQNGFSGLFTDIGLVVENTGHGTHRISGTGGQIFDGHA